MNLALKTKKLSKKEYKKLSGCPCNKNCCTNPNPYLPHISDLVELIPLYKTEGYNRLQIWKEFRSSGIRGDILIEAFRRTGLL